MTYKIDFANKSKASIYVKDKEYNNLTSLNMFGRYVENYGESLWTDILRILENWANDLPPLRPTEGQFWFDTTNKQLKVNTSRLLGQGNWVNVGAKTQYAPSSILKLTGGTLQAELIVSGDISDDNDPATKLYADTNCKVKLTSGNTKYQYNVLDFCNYATINGVVPQTLLSSGSYRVSLPINMKDNNYTVILSVASNAINGVVPTGSPNGHHYFVSNKTVNGFTISTDLTLLINCEIDFSVIGYAA